MSKKILKILLIFLFGALGGVWAQAYLLPYLMGSSFFDGEIVINQTQTITVQENVALTQAIERVEKTIVGVRTKTASGETLEGTGLAVTSDGLIVTLAELVPQGADFYFYVDGQLPAWQILKRDTKSNLALLKVDQSGLRTAGFANLEKTDLGERVFLLGTMRLATTTKMFTDEGIVSYFSQDAVVTNIRESKAAGSPLFNISGEVVGISMVGAQGRVSAIPAPVIRDFIGF
ncbi:MAG: trypsin-like peptidase domain-containing protein [Candidatus Nealsonbacteria bacterium]|nr:trypsin-like peptidase domain-containing protein [Candidatus Nealsonbacteria bacterium]